MNVTSTDEKNGRRKKNCLKLNESIAVSVWLKSQHADGNIPKGIGKPELTRLINETFAADGIVCTENNVEGLLKATGIRLAKQQPLDVDHRLDLAEKRIRKMREQLYFARQEIKQLRGVLEKLHELLTAKFPGTKLPTLFPAVDEGDEQKTPLTERQPATA